MQPNDTTTTKTQVATQALAFLVRTGQFAPIDAGLNPADFTDNDHAEFERMALQQEAFNALARAQRELLASRSDYPNAIKQAERAIAAMQALALVIEGGAA